MIEVATYRKKSLDSCEEFRRRSGSTASTKKWGKREAQPQFELRCCVNPEILKKNVENHWYFEDETVRLNGSVFARRENFNNLLSIIPLHKFNGIHIKMEDDCPQGGDDVRLCLLKTLGAHNLREVKCVGCTKPITVYDRYPLIDGVFFLSPVVRYGPAIEVIYDQRQFYIQQLCARCLFSEWECATCGKDDWFAGKSLILGTLYFYDVISAGRCCPPICSLCHAPLLVPENGHYALVNECFTCSSCGSRQYHLARGNDEVRIIPPSPLDDPFAAIASG
ncbi:unnamed protein product, partial [Mesorhabditis belari]|uniref:Headcase middle domain-containing protein n=2 Tax=Mesorhabditis belari TaxID=2138241 RepID=A0AAF3F3Y6_9BILA